MTSSSDIATRHDGAIVPDQPPAAVPDSLQKLQDWGQTFQAVATAAEALAQSPFVPAAFKGKPGDITAAVMAGMELGFSPMAALKAFDVIQGQAAPRAITIRAVVLSRGHTIRVVEWTDTICILEGLRKGDQEWHRVEWTKARAETMQLWGKAEWKKQPKTMLRARADSELGRIIAADALLGIPYSAEELHDMEPVTAEVVKSSSPHGRSLRDLAETIGRKVQRPQELTRTEATAVIQAIEALPASDDDSLPRND